MKTRHKRLLIIVIGVTAIIAFGLLVANAFRSNLVYFFSPTQVREGQVAVGDQFRLGGMVEKGSVRKSPDGLTVDFIVTDTNKTVAVHYEGILPDLFREGQGVVTQGALDEQGNFRAREVLAKHDEKYMPPEAAMAMKGGSFESGKGPGK